MSAARPSLWEAGACGSDAVCRHCADFILWAALIHFGCDGSGHSPSEVVFGLFPAGLGCRGHGCERSAGCVQVEIKQPWLSLQGSGPSSARSGNFEAVIFIYKQKQQR